MHDEPSMTAAELQQKGAQLRHSAHYAQAEHCLLRALEREHDFAAAHFELGLTYCDQQRFEDAADYLELAVHFAPHFAIAWLELGAVLGRLGRPDAALAACEKATALEPRQSSGWMAMGSLHKAREDWERAVECYRSAAACAPKSAEALCLLGYALFKAGDYAEARTQFDTAAQLSPDMVQAHHNLGLLLLETGRPDEALGRFKKALSINSDISETRTGLAHALRDLGRLKEAIQQYDAVLSDDPDFCDAIINRSHALLMKGDFAAGWAAYEQRFTGGGQVGRSFRYSPWRGEPLGSKRVLVYAEQGLGDEIMFASCVPDLLSVAGNCVIECNTRLAPLFRRSFPSAHVHGGEKKDGQQWPAGLPSIDCQVAIGSLPNVFRRTSSNFPAHAGYLAADAKRVEYWRARLRSQAPLRVGIAWRGGTLRSRQFTRSIPLALWTLVLRAQGAEFVALQYGDIDAELAAANVESAVGITHLGKAIDSIDELAAIIGALDLVISVDNTVAHLAGALGKTVWTLLPRSPEWRYPRSGEAMPWYPSMRLIHRAQYETWDAVLARVARELADIAQSKIST